MNEQEQAEVHKLINDFSDLFSDFTGKMGHYSGDKIEVKLKENSKPIKKTPYRVHPKLEGKLEKEWLNLQDQEIIEDSYSSWAAPAIVLEKPGRPDEIRLVVDYRKLII